MNIVMQVIRIICLILLAGVVLRYLYLGGLLLFFSFKILVIDPLVARFDREITPTMKFSPGEMVLITENGWGHEDDVSYWVEAIKGSTAVILSLDEYTDYFNAYTGKMDKEPPEYVQKCIEREEQYPVQFITVGALDGVIMRGDWVECQVGYVTLLPVTYLCRID